MPPPARYKVVGVEQFFGPLPRPESGAPDASRAPQHTGIFAVRCGRTGGWVLGAAAVGRQRRRTASTQHGSVGGRSGRKGCRGGLGQRREGGRRGGAGTLSATAFGETVGPSHGPTHQPPSNSHGLAARRWPPPCSPAAQRTRAPPSGPHGHPQDPSSSPSTRPAWPLGGSWGTFVLVLGICSEPWPKSRSKT